ncbi:MlaC/ttg2D family ABC transporter substrate-binding protein [Psittacicella hinzii]|uniref:Phospholipid transport system substrate-binding protein n=1 Tax=Psittacicella hinzii TaxID=2028575 RepID=A0A3A1YQQ3_9GAMM|nr:ABC transporter substrate-binding protein [Psittacicella hinzii]RIY39569.1 hypothetical protein CKF58_01910 [Psittacicella hinzii]
MKLKTLLLSFFVSLSLLFSSFASASTLVSPSSVDRANPEKVVTAAIDNTFFILNKYKGQISSSNQALRTDIKTNVLPFFNIQYISLSLLNTYARSATKEQLSEFSSVISDYMVNAYIEGLSFYTNETTSMGATTIQGKFANTAVNINAKNTTYNIVFKMFNLNNNYGIVDFTAQGISLVGTKASEWQQILRQSGVTGLTDYVRKNMNNILNSYTDQAK